MLMQKNSPNNNSKAIENDDANVNSMDSVHSNGHFYPIKNASLESSECNDDKSNDACSSDDDSHDQDNAEQENQTSFIDGSNRDLYKQSMKKKKKKSVKVKFSGTQEDKTGIKLKIRRTNNFNQDENHVIVDNVEQLRKRHLKNKRCKSDSQEGSVKIKQEDVSDDNLPHKRSKLESEDESKLSVGVNTSSKGTGIDEGLLGPCQAGTRLSLESVVLMETKSGILIVSVQWRGKTLMGALMESDRFQIGSLEKDSIYKREKLMGLNKRNTKRKSKNLFGKKKRKLTTADSGEHCGTENEAANSDVDNPYLCDKENCQMRFSDFQTLRIHIYQKHRVKSDFRTKLGAGGYGEAPHRSSLLTQLPLGSADRISATGSSEERNTFSPAYSDISDANEAPVLENEAELKPPPVAAMAVNSQPPVNLSLCHNPSLLAAVSSRMMFSPTAPALQPEVSLGSSPQLPSHIHHERKLPQAHNYRFPADTGVINGFLNSLSPKTQRPPPNTSLAHSTNGYHPSQTPDNGLNAAQDLSMNRNVHKYGHKPTDTNYRQKTAPSPLNCHKQSAHRHQPHMHNHHHIHSNNNPLSNGGISNHNSKPSKLYENGLINQSLSNGANMSHNLPYMSFSQSVNNQSNKFNYPINHMPLFQPKY